MNDRSRQSRTSKARSRTLTATATAAFLAASLATLVIEAGIMTPPVYAQTHKSPAAKGATESGGEMARGKYLVEGVAMCGECHTPRDGSGNLDRSRWLQGAPVPWAPADGGMSNWPLIAPRIGGNPPASDADMIKLLTTGIWTTGKPLRFPMMPFRMSDADAKAVVAYLKSVMPGK
jgi:mono/diheme cytochrome c family protein